MSTVSATRSTKRRERAAQPVPALTKPRKQRLPSVAERVLPNGLRVVVVRRARCRSSTCGCASRAPTAGPATWPARRC